MACRRPTQLAEELKTRLKQESQTSQEALGRAQQQQKKRYDEKVHIRVFQPGQKVLLLLPPSENTANVVARAV